MRERRVSLILDYKKGTIFERRLTHRILTPQLQMKNKEIKTLIIFYTEIKFSTSISVTQEKKKVK